MSNSTVVTAPTTAEERPLHVRDREPLISGTLANLALAGWLAGVLTFGRAFSEVGLEPMFVADVLAVAGALFSLPRWWPYVVRPGLRGLMLVTFSLALLTAQSVYRGAEAGNPSALKSACMGVYPLVALAVAGLVARDPQLIERFAKWVLPFVPLGSVLVGLSGGPYIPAGVGLYLACAAAWASTPGNPRRYVIGASTLIGVGYLVEVGASRGPALTVLLSVVATWIAAQRRTRTGSPDARAKAVIIGCFSIAVVTAAALMVSHSVNRIRLSEIPFAGPLASRVVASTQAGTESSNNIELRWRMWRYALETTVEDNPLFGRSSGQPIAAGFGSTVTIDRKSGVHNSFIGYAFYSGFLSALLVVLIFGLAVVGTWRRRAFPGRASLFGAVLAVAATCMTNVALETPYIAGPAWAVLGAAMGATSSIGRSAAPSNR